MSTKSVFDKVFSDTQKEIPFDPKWSSGDGFYDRVIANGDQLGMNIGETWKSTTPAGKRVLLHYTPLGLLVVFERFMADSSAKSGNFAIAYSAPAAIRESGFIFDPSSLFEADIEFIFGDFNLGMRLLQIYKNCKSVIKQHQAAARKVA